jgi:hypothetical protein
MSLLGPPLLTLDVAENINSRRQTDYYGRYSAFQEAVHGRMKREEWEG